MKNKKTITNVLTSGGQVALIGIMYYFLYRFLLEKLGVKLLGVWSVVMSASSIANIADLGIATSMVRFVSLYEHKNNLKRIPQLIFTGVVLNMLIFIPICLIIWPIAYLILGNIVEENYVTTARQLLPFSLLCVLLNSLAGVYGSLLDGFRKNYIRNSIFSFSSLLFLFFTILSVKKYGIIGVIWSQVFQSSLTLILCIIFATRLVKFNPFKWNWNKVIFKEIFSYGIQFQLTSITGILNEPVTKMLMSKFGGLAFTGYYEMASKLVMQIRGVIVSANQSLMPLMVKESVATENKKKFSVLSLSFASVFFISLLSLSFLNILSPIVSKVWIGHDEPIFINVLLVVSVCMFINLLSAPTYFALLSFNKLNPIIISQLIMAIINIALGYFLGSILGGYGIVFTWMIVVIVGSWYLIKSLDFRNTAQLFFKIKIETLSFVVLNILFVLLCRIFPDYIYVFLFLNMLSSGLIFFLILTKNKYLQ
ncbi:oligosaccharide flippase family protein [Chryseobacterium sp. PBS4-4]|uniref:Oligosaccharide flippase family protein n=1 Tax=Chryseobacterium edaphi TaxID=2976532 RepID=A0ABT2W923_9FLAO|nr:oligosaccharide flippase family protein [Chryseobacterium edaphi]MCU7618684.1 oligosaccharide flippase family protein [Chryseobacterium edaphi]